MNDQTGKHEGANKAAARYMVTLDLTEADANFAVTEALREFASRQRWEAEDDPTGNAASRVRWAEAAEAALERAENAQRAEMSDKPTASHAEADPGMVAVPRDDLRLAVSALRDLAAHASEPLGDFAGRLADAAGLTAAASGTEAGR